MPHYCDPVRLADEIEDYQKTGTLSDELRTDLDRIIHGVCCLLNYGADDPDAHQQTWLLLLRRLPVVKIDRSRSAFGWVSEVVRRELLQQMRTARRAGRAKAYGSPWWVPDRDEARWRHEALVVPIGWE
jgi:hypothetical protein